MWTVITTGVFDEWFVSADEEVREAVFAKVELLTAFGPMLKRPHADTLSDSKHSNMKELRVGTSGAVVRIAFAFDPERSAILLCAGDKSGVGQKQFYKRLIELADRLFDEHLEAVRVRARARKQKKGKER